MFWKKQQPAPPVGLRMVNGKFMLSHTYVLRLVSIKKPAVKPRFVVEWNGEPFSIFFEGFGDITLKTIPDISLKNMQAVLIQHTGVDGVTRNIRYYDLYYHYMNLDALEQYVREHTRELFASHGIDSSSYSLDELRIAGCGMERGWKLREEYGEGAS